MNKRILRAIPSFIDARGRRHPATRAEEIEESSENDTRLPVFSEPPPVSPTKTGWFRALVGLRSPVAEQYEKDLRAWEARRDAHEARRRAAQTAARRLAVHRAREARYLEAAKLEQEKSLASASKREQQLRADGRERAVALQDVSSWHQASALEFESHVAWLFRAQGWDARLTETTGDGGADIVMTKDGRRVVVQCKAHAAPQGSPVLRDLLGTKQDFKADGAILCALQGATPAGREFAERNGIQVINVADLAELARRISAEAGSSER